MGVGGGLGRPRTHTSRRSSFIFSHPPITLAHAHISGGKDGARVKEALVQCCLALDAQLAELPQFQVRTYMHHAFIHRVQFLVLRCRSEWRRGLRSLGLLSVNKDPPAACLPAS